MVKRQKKNTRKNRSSKGFKASREKARKINASTAYDTCTEQLSPFGGLLALIKFLDVVKFKEIFSSAYHKPTREPKLGHYSMVAGVLMLLFIGFNRIWHFTYIRLDALLCGFFRLPCLPVASTFWRYVDSLGINQANAFVKIMSILRERIWQLCDLKYHRVHLNIDTTVETLYGEQQGGRKGHNTKHRGKKGTNMELKDAIKTRRSVRRYKSKPVSKEIILELLEAASLAPSATNRQPWEFVVVHRSHLDSLDQVLREAFSERISGISENAMRQAIKDLSIPVDESGDKLKGLGCFYRTLGGAPVAIVVCVPKESDPWTWKNSISDAAAAIENLLLAAWDKGLGTCWLTGPLKTRAHMIASFLDIAEDFEIVAIVALGYPDHRPGMPPKQDIHQKVRWLGFD